MTTRPPQASCLRHQLAQGQRHVFGRQHAMMTCSVHGIYESASSTRGNVKLALEGVHVKGLCCDPEPRKDQDIFVPLEVVCTRTCIVLYACFEKRRFDAKAFLGEERVKLIVRNLGLLQELFHMHLGMVVERDVLKQSSKLELTDRRPLSHNSRL